MDTTTNSHATQYDSITSPASTRLPEVSIKASTVERWIREEMEFCQNMAEFCTTHSEAESANPTVKCAYDIGLSIYSAMGARMSLVLQLCGDHRLMQEDRNHAQEARQKALHAIQDDPQTRSECGQEESRAEKPHRTEGKRDT